MAQILNLFGELEPVPDSGKKKGRKSKEQKVKEAEQALQEQPSELVPFELTKQYYSISEVAAMFEVNTSLIRFWEKEFDILKPRKNKKGDRLFRQEDVINLRLIFHLLKEKKFTIKGAQAYLKENKQAVNNSYEAIQSLTKLRTFLTEFRDAL